MHVYTVEYPKVLNIAYTALHTVLMVKEALTKIQQVGSRHTLYLQKDLVNDSVFPFKPKEQLLVRIEGNRLIIEKPKK